ncbi:hypothetical protein LIP_0294 [Limnochorda pilosa]|uniref:Uncharacterized protein n=1 Tax=Limnochorda pilosa TaxID=1555112 RepID=A0A0K2SGD1_LIMPI|nr:hypothetical protein LIP_0294 [Limnochorda pilosa]
MLTTYRGRKQVMAEVDDRTDVLRGDGWGEEELRAADLAALAQNRSGVYDFLAAIYNQLPDDELVEMLRGPAFEEAVRKIVDQGDAPEEMQEGCRLILHSLEALRSEPVEEGRTALAVDRTRLVRRIKSGCGPPPPYDTWAPGISRTCRRRWPSSERTPTPDWPSPRRPTINQTSSGSSSSSCGA